MPADVMEEEISPHMQFTHSFARVFNEGFQKHVVSYCNSVDFFFFSFFSFLFWFLC
jgi:hypothetical protein